MIFFKGVSKKFGNHVVLDDLNLHIKKGQITFILGKSGEGKSVTIKHIMGLLKPDTGSIIVDGVDISRYSGRELRQYRRKFGMLFQHAALFDSLSVLENIMFPLEEHTLMSSDERLERVHELLVQAGIENLKNKLPNELSTGEKKRVGLARALAAKPKILLYDEPTTGMDPLICEMIDKLIVEVGKKENEMTSVIISHDLKAALATAHHIIMLYKGQVAYSGTPEDFRNVNDPIIRQFFSGRVEGPMEFF